MIFQICTHTQLHTQRQYNINTKWQQVTYTLNSDEVRERKMSGYLKCLVGC